MKMENHVIAAIGSSSFELLHDKYGFDIVACEDMPDCNMGHEVHLIAPLEDLLEFLEDAEAAEIEIENLTEQEKKEKALEISEVLEERELFAADEMHRILGLER
jgi:hypothetical protein